MKSHKYIKDYSRTIKLIMYKRYGIKLTDKMITQTITYFLKNIIVSLFNQIPVTVREFFSIYIYPEKKKKN